MESITGPTGPPGPAAPILILNAGAPVPPTTPIGTVILRRS